MKSILWRTLLSFWFVIAVILAVVVFTSVRVGQQGSEELYSTSGREIVDTATDIFAEEGIQGVREWVSNPQTFPPGVTLYLLDAEGDDALGRHSIPLFLWPRWSGDFVQGTERDGGGTGSGKRLPTLVAEDGTVYWIVVGPAPQPSLGVFGIPSVQWILLLTALGASAIACLVFTEPLRRRLFRLEAAAESLAKGDLGARVNLKTSDELGAVGQQFDRMAERIEKLVRSRHELYRNVSHEIRSPLARIQVALALAQEELGSGNENIERIRHETKVIDTLMQQIMELAKLEDSEHELQTEELDLVEVVSLVVDDARFETKMRKKLVNWDPPQDPFKVYGVAEMLSSAVENILRNAVAHSPDDAEIDVTLIRRDGKAKLRISDHGDGVAQSELEQIFEPFYKLGSAQGGAGLGLAITTTAVSLMNGTIEATQTAGGGLEVTIMLPLA